MIFQKKILNFLFIYVKSQCSENFSFQSYQNKNLYRGVSKGGAGGGAIAPPLFGRIEGAAGGGAAPHYYLYYYLPPHFKKLLTPLSCISLLESITVVQKLISFMDNSITYRICKNAVHT